MTDLRRLTVAVLLATVAGCARGDASATAARSAPEPHTAAPISTAPTTTPPPSAPHSLISPAASAGPLGRRNVPPALDLGPGWKTYADPGEAEAGYLGSGSWVRARNVSDVVAGIVPLGCLELTSLPRLPVPAFALEATYRSRAGAPAVALVLDYPSASAAAAMLAGVGRIARSCPAPASPVGHHDPLTVVVRPAHVDADTVLDRRHELGQGASEWAWSEAVVRRGARVGLLIVASDPAAKAPDLDDLAARLRAAVTRR